MDRKVEAFVSYIIRSRNRGRTMAQLVQKFGGDTAELYRAARAAGVEVYFEREYADGWRLRFLCHEDDPVRKET